MNAIAGTEDTPAPPAPVTGAAIEVEGVSKTFAGRIRALRDVSLRVAP